MPRRSRTRGAGKRDSRQAGLGIRTPSVSTIVTPIAVIEGARDIVYTLLNGTVDTGGANGVMEDARDLIYNELNASLPEV